jgi:hypothetical protein
VKLRTATIVTCVLDAAVWAAIALAAYSSGSDQATIGLDRGAGIVVTALFLLTTAPAIALTLLKRGPVTALVLALAFPVVFAAAFIAAVVALS